MLNRSDASSLLPITDACRVHYGLDDDGTLVVSMETIDSLSRERSMPPPDLLKLDIQGFELEALRGGTDTLARTDAIITEVSFVELYRGQCLFHDLTAFLAERGFHAFAFGVDLALGQPVLQADVLFASETGAPRLRDRRK